MNLTSIDFGFKIKIVRAQSCAGHHRILFLVPNILVNPISTKKDAQYKFQFSYRIGLSYLVASVEKHLIIDVLWPISRCSLNITLVFCSKLDF